jgi:hypothetical protein
MQGGISFSVCPFNRLFVRWFIRPDEWAKQGTGPGGRIWTKIYKARGRGFFAPARGRVESSLGVWAFWPLKPIKKTRQKRPICKEAFLFTGSCQTFSFYHSTGFVFCNEHKFCPQGQTMAIPIPVNPC